MSRLAFGANLLYPVDTLREAYCAIAPYLPAVKVDLDGMTELIYQVNRPRASRLKIEELAINRLSRWMPVRLISEGLNLEVDAAQGEAIPVQRTVKYGCNVLLDINTQPEFGEALPASELRDLLRELVDLGTEIVEKGDVP